ncbi:ubiquitin-like-conjugating enzyme ATG10 [Actinia tenebrosa]|uniref:Ubiquitin-like-conjugating enzyme ATG10 n=1 Tax=Actinia tenebrosa TaxID=6105 RepID=A0A6P8HME1_ACTTE|nr:ubiquitin-like-conjugating enzyme ATG10 [Actinia tenebrosa]
MWKDGRISCVQFNHYLDGFLERSRSLGDEWVGRSAPQCLQLDPTQPVRYLIKQCFREITTAVQTREAESENIEFAVNEKDECECSCDVPSKSYAKYEYHVMYSPSYGVPVLYFTASTQDGRPLSLEEVWKSIPDVYQLRLKDERWTFLTQQEHPILGKPFFQLHPCHTADMMKNIVNCVEKEGKTNYLVTWLSSVGPVVGLHLSLEYAKNTHL